MTYLIAVLRDRSTVEAACAALAETGWSSDFWSVVGEGWESSDRFGLLNPKQRSRQRVRWMATWLVPFGFAGGLVFSKITGLETFAWAGPVGNDLVGGVLGALSGLMGSAFIGGGFGVGNLSGFDPLPFRNRLEEGKFVLILRGNDAVTTQAWRLLRSVDPESLQTVEESL